MKAQRLAFIQKFGREPGPEDPVFFDPNQNTPQPINPSVVRDEVIKAMTKANIDPAIIYAYNKTGILVTEANHAQFGADDIKEYEEALEEYHRLSKRKV